MIVLTPIAPADVPVGGVAVGLIVVGVLLTAPISAALARARWTRREPRIALILWQAVCLAAGFSVVSGLVLLAVEPLGTSVLQGAWRWFGAVFTGTLELPAWRVACGILALLISGTLLAVVARTAEQTARRRRAHRRLVDLLTRPADVLLPAAPGVAPDRRLRILDHDAAIAYTLPGWHARVVVSAGLVELLSRDELAAVIEHERAHLRARHDLLLLPFQAWAVALGRVPGVGAAGASVAELTEMLADDVAAARTSRTALAAALAKVALAAVRPLPARSARQSGDGRSVPSVRALAAVSGSRSLEMPTIARTAVTQRVQRLLHPRPLPAWGATAAYASAAFLLTIPASILLMHWA